MITSLFKPAWKSESIEKRLGAIASLKPEDEEHQQILLELSEDPESSVVIAAIPKISSVDRLLELSSAHESEKVREAAKDCLAKQFGEDSGLDEAQCLQLLKDHPALCPYLATHAVSSTIRHHAIDALSDQQKLEVLKSTGFTDTRQYIADQLHDIHDLETARKYLRGKDKKAERTLKGKIDHIRQLEREQAERTATVDKLTQEAEYLASHDWLPEFKARVVANRNLWDALDFEVPEPASQRYQQARGVIDERFEAQRLIDETQTARSQLLDDIKAMLKAQAQFDIEQAIQSSDDSQTQLDTFIVRWEKLQHAAPAEETARKAFTDNIHRLNTCVDLISRISSILKPATLPEDDAEQEASKDSSHDWSVQQVRQLETALKGLDWPAEQGELRWVKLLRQRISQWHDEAKAAAAEHEQKLNQLHKKISSVFRFSRQGNLARARHVYQRAEKSLAAYHGKERSKLEDRLKEALEVLGKMDDWKDFATEPKYIELCEAMEKLVDSKLHPDNLSGKIKSLQKRWKELGYSHVSDTYWPRFKQAADKAYKPCSEFFAQRHEVRHENLDKREHIVEQMRQLLEQTDWDDEPDYKAAQSAMRKISDQFAAIKDVERGAGQKQWKKFSRLRDAVYAHLDVAYEKNIKLKLQLVEQITALADSPPREENLVSLKTLQTRWKNVGITRRNADQKAWKQFKKQGDIVFNNVKALRQSHRNEIDQHLDTYRVIIRDIHMLAKTATDLADADHRFAELQASYAELPDLPHNVPEKLVQGIKRDYNRACDLFDERHRNIVIGLHEQQIEALRQKAELCAEMEALGSAADDKKLQRIDKRWDDIEIHDTELARRIEARRISALEPVDRDEIAAQRRLLCIKLEIAQGKESPPQDRDLRMQYQLEQMNQSGLGHQIMDTDSEVERMEIDWLCMPGAAPEQQKALDQRFRRALEH